MIQNSKIGIYEINFTEKNYFKIISYIPTHFFSNKIEHVQVSEILFARKNGKYILENKNENYKQIIIKEEINMFLKSQIKNINKLTWYEFDYLNMKYDEKNKFILFFSQKTYSKIKINKKISIKMMIKTIELLKKNKDEIFWKEGY